MVTRTDIGHGRGWLSPRAAASLARVDEEMRDAFGRVLDVNEAGRTWDRQNQHWQTYLRDGWPIALHPDTPSVHQLGDALDTDDWQLEAAAAILHRNGWRQTVYRDGKLAEGWHWEYFEHLDTRRGEGTSSPATFDKEDEDMILVQMPNKEKDCFAIGLKRIKHIGNIPDLNAAKKTCGPLIACNDREFRVALIVRSIPYSKARAGADWQG